MGLKQVTTREHPGTEVAMEGPFSSMDAKMIGERVLSGKPLGAEAAGKVSLSRVRQEVLCMVVLPVRNHGAVGAFKTFHISMNLLQVLLHTTQASKQLRTLAALEAAICALGK